MLRLTCIREREQGAVAMIVAMLFGFGVMIGLAALTIDVGNINADRRQLQNGADAVALAVAQQCATTGTCDPTATNLGYLANANAADNATAIKRVDNQLPLLAPTTNYPAICGKAGNATGLLECDPAWIQSMSNLQECPSTPSSGKYVRVYAETKNSAGGNLLPYSFGAAIAGVGSGANQQACATVAWGTLSKATVFPFAFSGCEWSVATTGQTLDPPPTGVTPTYEPGPPYSGTNLAQPSWQKAIVLDDNTATTDCANWQGHDLPGGFGWVNTTSCNVTLSAGDWIGIDQGMGKGNNCTTDITQSVHKIINIPVYDCIDDLRKEMPCAGRSSKQPGSADFVNPSSAFYHIKGFASFYMTGIEVTGQINIAPDFPPSTAKDPTASEACLGGKCIYGWFLRDLIPVGGDLGGSEDFGTTFIKIFS